MEDSPESHERTARTYRGYAQSGRKRRAWTIENPGNVAIRDELSTAACAALGDALQGRLLDVGCGTGWWLERLAAGGADPTRLHGVDLLPQRVTAARERVPGAVIEAADARSLPFADGTFDAVTMLVLLSSLEHREAMRAALREAVRVRAPGGRLLVWDVTVPNPANRATRRVPARWLDAELGRPDVSRRITLLPPLARRLGRATPALYARLAALPAACTHRIAVYSG